MKVKIPTKSTYFKDESLSNLEMFRRIVAYVNLLAGRCGCNIFSIDFTFNSLCFYVAFGNVISCFIITFYDFILFREDLVRICFLMLTLGVGVQGLSKLYTFAYYRSNILDLVARTEKFLTNYNTRSANEIFEKWLLIICHVGLAITMLIGLCSFLIVIYPLIFYAFMNERILHFGLELPWIDWTSILGYMANFIYASSLVYLYVFGFISSCFLSISLLVSSFAQFELVKVLIEELNEIIISNVDGSRNDEIKSYIKCITDMHNELIE